MVRRKKPSFLMKGLKKAFITMKSPPHRNQFSTQKVRFNIYTLSKDWKNPKRYFIERGLFPKGDVLEENSV
ncbi:MAG: hypothetical protein ACETWD_01270 [Desulfatiglandales bacterium]